MKEFVDSMAGAYSLHECHRALMQNNGEGLKAAEALVGGSWKSGKLVTYSWSAIDREYPILAQKFGVPEHEVIDLVKTTGSLEMTRRILAKEPLLKFTEHPKESVVKDAV